MNYRKKYGIKSGKILRVKNAERLCENGTTFINYRYSALSKHETEILTIAESILDLADEYLESTLLNLQLNKGTLLTHFSFAAPYIHMEEDEYRNLIKMCSADVGTGLGYLKQQLKNYLLEVFLIEISAVNDYLSCDKENLGHEAENIKKEHPAILDTIYPYLESMQRPETVSSPNPNLAKYSVNKRSLRSSIGRKSGIVLESSSRDISAQEVFAFTAPPWQPESVAIEYIKLFQQLYLEPFDFARYIHEDFAFGFLRNQNSSLYIPKSLSLYVGFVSKYLSKGSQNLYKRCHKYKTVSGRSQSDRFRRLVGRYREYWKETERLQTSLNATDSNNTLIIANLFLLNRHILAKQFFGSLNSPLYRYVSSKVDMPLFVDLDPESMDIAHYSKAIKHTFYLDLLKQLVAFDIDSNQLGSLIFFGDYDISDRIDLLKPEQIDEKIKLPLHFIYAFIYSVSSSKGDFLSEAFEKFISATEQNVDGNILVEMIATIIRREIGEREVLKTLANNISYETFTKNEKLLFAELLSSPSAHIRLTVT